MGCCEQSPCVLGNKELEMHGRIVELLNKEKPLSVLIDCLCRDIERIHEDTECRFQIFEKAPAAYPESMPCPMFHEEFASGANDNIVGFLERKMEMSAKGVGFKSCWSYPVKNNREETLGIFALYQDYQNPLNDAELLQLERYANLFQLIVEWSRMQKNTAGSIVSWSL